MFFIDRPPRLWYTVLIKIIRNGEGKMTAYNNRRVFPKWYKQMVAGLLACVLILAAPMAGLTSASADGEAFFEEDAGLLFQAIYTLWNKYPGQYENFAICDLDFDQQPEVILAGPADHSGWPCDVYKFNGTRLDFSAFLSLPLGESLVLKQAANGMQTWYSVTDEAWQDYAVYEVSQLTFHGNGAPAQSSLFGKEGSGNSYIYTVNGARSTKNNFTRQQRNFDNASTLQAINLANYAFPYSWNDALTAFTNTLPDYSFNTWLQEGDIVTFGYYEQDGNTRNGSEPVEWIVLETDWQNGRVLLLSSYALDMQRYNSQWNHINWQKCSVRSWLNGTFYNKCFTTKEKRAVLSTTLDSNYGNTSVTTSDRVFFLSADEVARYLPTAADRQAVPTAYAQKQKVAVTGGTCWWWLRGSSQRTNDADSVKYTGEITTYGTNTNGLGFGVRPAVWVDASYFEGN